MAASGMAVEVNSDLLRWVCKNGGGSSVRAVDEDGLRGLVADRDASVGDVILEVPLALTISDIESGNDTPVLPLPGAAPAWTAGLPWNVQLALAVIERQRGAVDPFMSSWPSEPPALPSRCEADELALASDPSIAQKADEAFFWLDEQYWVAKKAAEGAGCVSEFPSAETFRDALELVWSRCLRLSTGSHGVRRLLVPYLDLANHEAAPSAMYAFASGASGGPAIRLHAARALREGEPVTITYGEHSNCHFALYYGFVPEPSPFDAVQVTLPDVLSITPEALRGPEPAGGWEGALRALAGHAALGGKPPDGAFELRATAPEPALLHTLAELLPGGEAAAARAVALTVAAIEEALWGAGASDDAAAAASIAADEAKLLASSCAVPAPEAEAEPLSERGALMVRLRLSRRRLLSSLRRAMHDAADAFGEDSNAQGDDAAATAAAALAARLAAATPEVYPELDKLPVEELRGWETREWDWSSGAFR